MAILVFIIIGLIAIGVLVGAQGNSVQKAKVATLSSIEGFTPAIRFDGEFGGLGLAIDPTTNRFAIAGVGVPPRVFSFDQLIAVDVERDGTMVTTTKGSVGLVGAAAGVALLGPMGLLLGGSTKSVGRSVSKVTKLALKIYVNDLVKPCFEVAFFSSAAGADPNSGMLALSAQKLDEWYGRFRTILAMRSSAAEGEAASTFASLPDSSFEPARQGWLTRTFGA